MSSLFRMDPGPCPVCDAPHTTCTAPMTVTSQLLPMRDAAAVAKTPPPAAPALAPNEFTSATYRRALHGRKDRTR